MQQAYVHVVTSKKDIMRLLKITFNESLLYELFSPQLSFLPQLQFLKRGITLTNDQ